MRLGLHNIHHYLISKGLLSTEAITRGHYSATARTFRSVIYEVASSPNTAMSVKQLNSDHDKAPYLIQKEATALWSIWNEDAFEKLRPFSPSYLGYDVDSQILITEHIRDSQNLDEYQSQNNEVFEKMLFRLISILRVVHLDSQCFNGLVSTHFFRQELPWIFHINDSYENGDLLMPQYWPVIDFIRSHESLWSNLNETREKWQANSFIHGDIKWSNVLLKKEGEDNRLWLIDWEMADIGDPFWDLAGVAQNIICHQVFKNDLDLKQVDLNWALIKSLLDHYYTTDSNQSVAEISDSEKLLDFTIIRLLQSATEINEYRDELMPNALKLLHMTKEIASMRDQILKEYLY